MNDSLSIELQVTDAGADVVLSRTKQKLTDFVKETERIQPQIKFHIPNQNFIDLEKLEKRADETRRSFAGIVAQRLDNGQIGNLTKEVVRASERSRVLSSDIAGIKRELANPNRKSSIAFLTDELRGAEKELEILQRKLNSLHSPNVSVNTNQSGFNSEFQNRVFGGYAGMGAAGVVGGIAGGATLAGINAVTSVVESGASAWLDYSSKIEQARIGLTTLTGSQEAANAQIKEIQNLAKNSPFRFDELLQASRQFQAVGKDGTQALSIIKDVGNALSASGKLDMFPNAVKALTDIQAKGKLAGQEIIQLANAGIPIRDILVKQLNKAPEEIVAMGEKGLISADLIFAALQKMSSEKFGDAMEAQSKTFAGSMNRIKDSLLIASQEGFAPFYEEISKFSSRLADNLNNQEPEAKSVAFAFGATIGQAIADGMKEKDGITTPMDVGEAIGNAYKEYVKGFSQPFAPNRETEIFDDSQKSPDVIAREKAAIDAAAAKDRLQKQETANLKANISLYEQQIAIQRAYKTESIDAIRETAALEQSSIKDQIRLMNRYYSDKIRNLTDEEFAAGKANEIRSQGLEAINRLNTQLAVSQINANKQIAENIEKAQKKIEESGKTVRSLLDDVFQKTAANNPIAKAFNEGDAAIRKMRESLKNLPPQMQAVGEKAIEMQEKLNRMSVFEARTDNRLSILDLKNQAENFRNPLDPDKQKHDEETFIKRFLYNNPNYLFLKQGEYDQRNLLSNGLTSFESFDEFIRKDILKRAENTIDSPKSRLNKSFEDKYNSLFANPFQTDEQRASNERKFLANLSGVNPLDLNSSLREKAAQFAEREADRKSQNEDKDFKLREAQIKATDELTGELKKLRQQAEKDGFGATKSIVEIVDKSNGAANVKGASPSQNDTAQFYGLGFVGGTNR